MFGAVTPLVQKIAIAGAGTFRIRAKADAICTISFAFLRPDGLTPYATDNPADMVLAAGVEEMFDFNTRGEELLQLSLLGAGAGILTWIDVMQAETPL